jgi:hypothetical protein
MMPSLESQGTKPTQGDVDRPGLIPGPKSSTAGGARDVRK